ncbi:hypothetical protein ACFLYJ_02995 [Candidatus Cloacimonadota bacterium]
MKTDICFFTLLSWKGDKPRIDLLIESLRTFGGELKDCPVWIFTLINTNNDFSRYENVQLIPLEISKKFHKIFFSPKVFACAAAEELAVQKNVKSLVWLGSSGFFVNPPEQFDLGTDFDAAFRPVHHRNVGISINEKLDDFWQEIYDFIGLKDSDLSVETFVESEKIKPYFNSHLFSLNPQKGILQKWLKLFCQIHAKKISQKPALADDLHQIFLHQALLSTLLAKHLDWDRIRILTADYSYPLHMHHQVPPEKQSQTLNELVCPVYEEIFNYPETLNDLKAEEPLKSWLKERMRSNQDE